VELLARHWRTRTECRSPVKSPNHQGVQVLPRIALVRPLVMVRVKQVRVKGPELVSVHLISSGVRPRAAFSYSCRSRMSWGSASKSLSRPAASFDAMTSSRLATRTRTPSIVIAVAPSRSASKPSTNPEGANVRSRSPKRVVKFSTLIPCSDSAEALNGSASVPAARILAPSSVSAAARFARLASAAPAQCRRLSSPSPIPAVGRHSRRSTRS